MPLGNVKFSVFQRVLSIFSTSSTIYGKISIAFAPYMWVMLGTVGNRIPIRVDTPMTSTLKKGWGEG